MKKFDIPAGLIVFLFYTVVISAIIGVSIWLSYEIAVSDLPDWFKFWLLR